MPIVLSKKKIPPDSEYFQCKNSRKLYFIKILYVRVSRNVASMYDAINNTVMKIIPLETRLFFKDIMFPERPLCSRILSRIFIICVVSEVNIMNYETEG